MLQITASTKLQPATNPTIPSAVWRMLSSDTSALKIPRGLDALWHHGLGTAKRVSKNRTLFMKRARMICAMDAWFSALTDDGLAEIVAVVSRKFRLGRAKREDEDRAFALVREVAYRKLGMKPHLVQVAAALAMDAGCIAELATGEGKTLVATMPATVAGWRGRGCHVITVNDYLARRDADIMKPLYEYCGLKVASIVESMPPNDRRKAYLADITYCTNKTVAADFLRDRLTLGDVKDLPSALIRKITRHAAGPDRLVMRGLEVALVDEADSVLIDESTTPLIIAREANKDEQPEDFMRATSLVKELRIDEDYDVDFRFREVMLTERGKKHLRELRREMKGVWRSARRSEELVVQAITAHELFFRGQHYFVEEDKVVIIDESTGRAMPDRSWQAGIHQAVEAKEGLPITPHRETLARVSFQRFFRLYRKLAGMTGTAAESRRELWQIYHLPVIAIPTHKAIKRRKYRDRFFANADSKWKAVVDAVKREHARDRPVLVGTSSVEDSETLSTLLNEAGLEHNVLNAMRHAEEARIVAKAGKTGKITVATNMAGRGTDIKLGKGVKEVGGLAVIAAERAVSPRIDRQLFGRAGRQGDPGSAAVYASLDDELIKRYTPRWLRPLAGRIASRKHGEVSSPLTRWMFDAAQRKAERVAANQRKSVLHADDWLQESLGFAGQEI